jgi:hypothetical protein
MSEVVAHNKHMTKAKRGRKPLPEGEAQTEMIKARVTPSLKAAYVARGEKAWLVKALKRKPRP